MSVDFPKPVWPVPDIMIKHCRLLLSRSHDLPTQITLNWNPRFRSLRSIWFVMLSKPTWLLGMTGLDCDDMIFAAAMLLHGSSRSCCVTCQSCEMGFGQVRFHCLSHRTERELHTRDTSLPELWEKGLAVRGTSANLMYFRAWQPINSVAST